MKTELTVSLITKSIAAELIGKHHYLSVNHGAGFMSGVNYGLFKGSALVGVCVFSSFGGRGVTRGAFGFSLGEGQYGMVELTRLVLEPEFQKAEHNAASWFVSRSIKLLRKEKPIRAILSYADNDYHSGIVYAASNFRYYGLTDKKSDFHTELPDGTFVKCKKKQWATRGEGKYIPRSQKHRFLMVFDKSLTVKWPEKKWVPREKIVVD